MQITEQNKPYLIGMILISLLIVGAVFVLINMVGESVNSDLENINKEIKEEIENEMEEESELETEKITTQQCLTELGFSKFIFLHSPSCGYCRAMMPIVESLVREGYDIQIVNAVEDSNFAKISNCMTLKNSVPQFICNKNGKADVGSMSKEELIEVYNSC